MKAREFIAEKLRKLHAEFPQIRIRYEYRFCTGSHIIEVKPLRFFENDEAYGDEEESIWDEFEALFPQEHILFISEGFLTEIEHADLELGYGERIHFDKAGVPDIKFTLDDYLESIAPQHDKKYALAA